MENDEKWQNLQRLYRKNIIILLSLDNSYKSQKIITECHRLTCIYLSFVMAFCALSSDVGASGSNLTILSNRSDRRTGFLTSDSRNVLNQKNVYKKFVIVTVSTLTNKSFKAFKNVSNNWIETKKVDNKGILV